MTDFHPDTELAARRAVIASCYGVPPGYVPHCGYCGKPRPCQCGTTPARDVLPISNELVDTGRSEAPTMPKPANTPPDEPPPSGWRDRPGLL